mgnify:CR=1 FL=1
MKTKKLLLVCALLVCTFFNLQAQHKFYVGSEFGLGIEFQNKQDKYNLAQSVNRFGASPYGLTLRYERDDKYAFEIGMIKEPLMQDVRINNVDFKSTFEAGDRTTSYVRVPLRLNVKALNFGERTALHVYGGGSYFHYPLDTGFRYGTWSGDFEKDAMAWRKDHYVLEKSAWLLEGGTSLSYRLSNKFTVDANVNYLHGFDNLTQNTIKYKPYGGDVQQSEVYSNGTKLNFTIGVRYKVMELRKLNE